MGEITPGGAGALDRALDQRRNEIRKRWNAVATDAGMTPQHLSRIRRGEVPLTGFAARGLDIAVHWPAGTAMAYYRTGQPPGAAERPAPGTAEWWEDLARKLPEKEFWEVVAVAKQHMARAARRAAAERIDNGTERDSPTESRT